METQFLSGSTGCGTEEEKWNSMQDIKVVLAVMVLSIFKGGKRQLLSKY